MSDRLKRRCASLAVDYAKDGYRWASDLPTTIFDSSAQHEIRCFYRPIKSSVSNNFFSTYCTEFLKLGYRDIIAFRTKNWKDEKMVIDSLQTSCFPLWRGKILSDHCQMRLWCNKHLPGWSISIILVFEFFGMFISPRTPSVSFGGEEKLCLFSK